jgi:hypothetical protein
VDEHPLRDQRGAPWIPREELREIVQRGPSAVVEVAAHPRGGGGVLVALKNRV